MPPNQPGGEFHFPVFYLSACVLRSAFTTFITNTEYLKYPDRGSGCDLPRFEYSYGIEDIKKLQPLIGK